MNRMSTRVSIPLALGTIAVGAFLVFATIAQAITGTFVSNQTTANLVAVNDQTATTLTTVANVTTGADTNQALADATPTANVAGVTEVKASRTLTVNAAPATTETITIGTCVVTFLTTASATLDELDCTDSAATIDTNTGVGDVVRTASDIASVLRTLTNVSDAAHGGLTVSGATVEAIFTTTGAETSATPVSFVDGTTADITSTSSTTGVVGVAGVAQVSTATPSNVEVGDTFSTTINGLQIDFVATVATVANVTAGLTSAINGSAQAANVTAVDGGSLVTITADVAGTAFTITSTATNRAPVAQINTVTIAGTVEPGDTFTVTGPVGGDVSYIVQPGDTTNDMIATGLNAAIQADGDYAAEPYTSGVVGSVITLTADVAGTGFVQTSGTTNRTPVAQVVDFTPALPTVGETYRATINGNNYDYDVIAVVSIQTIVEALEPLMEVEANTTCSEDDTKITCTADVAGTAFTHNATVVDDTSPTVVSVTTAHADGSYPAGTMIDFTITFSEPVDVDTTGGTPSLTLNSGGSATYLSGDTTSALVFRYTVGGGQTSSDLDYTGTGSLVLNSGTIVDVNGFPTPNNAVLTLPAPSIAAVHAIVIDTTAPTVIVNVVDTGLAVGETSLVTFTFSETVTGFDNADIVLTNANGTIDTASSTGATTYAAVFTPNAVEDNTNTIDVNLTGVADVATNPGVGSTASNNYTIDTIAPIISSISFHITSGTIAIGDVLIVTIDANQIGYTLGAATVNGEGVTGFVDNGDTTYDVLYTVTNGDTDRAQSEQIPVSIELIDGALNSTTFTTSPIAGLTPAVDANPPSVPSALDLCICEDTGFSDSDNLTNLDDVFIDGSADIGSTVNLYVDGVLVGQELVTFGSWSIPTGTLADGTYDIDATATDAAGNVSASSTILAITIDTDAPTTPIAPDLDMSSDTGANTADDLTFDTTPLFIVSAEAGSIITLYVDGNVEGTVPASGGLDLVGVSIPLVGDGTYDVEIDATDAAGNVSSLSSILVITLDTQEPTLAEVTPIAEFTNVFSPLPVYGFSSDEAGDITYGGSCSSATTLAAAATNNLFFTAPTADSFYNDCEISVTDAAGNLSDPLAVSAFTIDTIAPVPSLVAFSDAFINIANETSIDVTFTITDINNVAVVFPTLFDGTNTITPIALSTTTPSNPFTFTATFDASGLDDGNIIADVTANDIAGNVGSTGGTDTVTKDTMIPTLLSATIASDNTDTTLATVGDTVTLLFETNETVGTPVVTIDGNAATVTSVIANIWEATRVIQSGDTEGLLGFTIDFTDTAGNDGLQVGATTDLSGVVFDETAPTVVVTTSDVDGKVKAGTMVTITATFSEPILGAPVPTVTIAGSDTLGATPMTFVDSTHYTYDYVAGAGNGVATFTVDGAEDLAGNPQVWNFTSLTLDNIEPTISVLGSNPHSIFVSLTPYTDAGATAFDVLDATTTVVTTGSVDSANAGVYVLTYTSTDAAGNSTSTSRSVTVNHGGGGGGPNPGGGGGGGGGGGSGFVGSGSNSPSNEGVQGTTGGTTGQVLGAASYNFTRNFGIGSTGTDVTELQKILIAEGFLKIAAPTGTFGPLTFAALKAYQTAHGIVPASGYVGPLTRAELNKGASAGNAALLVQLLAQLLELQKKLKAAQGI